jgi:hypothetical protein
VPGLSSRAREPPRGRNPDGPARREEAGRQERTRERTGGVLDPSSPSGPLNRHLRKVVQAQNRELSEAAARERQMRVQIQHLPEPVVKAYVDVIRRRGDLSMSEALSLVSEVFAADE